MQLSLEQFNKGFAGQFRDKSYRWYWHEDFSSDGTTFPMAWELGIVTWTNFAFLCGPDLMIKNLLKAFRAPDIDIGAGLGAGGPDPVKAAPPLVYSNDLPPFFFPARPRRPPAASIFFRRACIRVVMVHIGIVHMTLTHPAADAIARLDNGPGLVRCLAMYLFRIAE